MPEEVNNTPRPRSERRKRAARERITDEVELGVERTIESGHRVINKVNFDRSAIMGAVGGLVAGFFLGSAIVKTFK